MSVASWNGVFSGAHFADAYAGFCRACSGNQRLCSSLDRHMHVFTFRLVTVFMAMYLVCMHQTSGITRAAVSTVAAISTLLLAVILYNSDWRSPPSIHALARKLKRIRRMVSRAPEEIWMRWKTIPRSSTLAFESVPWLKKTRSNSSGSCLGAAPSGGGAALQERKVPKGDQMV